MFVILVFPSAIKAAATKAAPALKSVATTSLPVKAVEQNIVTF